MKTVFLVLTISLLLASQSWAAIDEGHPREGLMEQYKAGELQFAVAVDTNEVPLPETWTDDLVVEWLDKGWLTVEKRLPPDKLPGGGYKCHLVTYWFNGSHYMECANGAGAVRCPCDLGGDY